jgi:hypothetical protein
MGDASYKQQSRGSQAQMTARENLYALFDQSPLPREDLLVNLSLYTRASVLARTFFLNEIYELIIGIPGCVMEFGTWWGQSIITFESLRAIHEPYNHARRIIGFDTFAGYQDVGEHDRASETIKSGGYATTSGYRAHLEALLDYHESENVMSQIKKHELVEGDVADTVPSYLADHPETIVALAFFDLALYEPTKACLEAIKPHLVTGSVLAFDEFNAREYPGETVAVAETVGLTTHQIFRSKFLPDRSYMIIR